MGQCTIYSHIGTNSYACSWVIVSVEVVVDLAVLGAICCNRICEVGRGAICNAQTGGIQGEIARSLANRHAFRSSRQILPVKTGYWRTHRYTFLSWIIRILRMTYIALSHTQIEMRISIAVSWTPFQTYSSSILSIGAIGAHTNAGFGDIMPVERWRTFINTNRRRPLETILQIRAHRHASSVETISKRIVGTSSHASSSIILSIDHRAVGRARVMANSIPPVIIRSWGTLDHAKTSTIISIQQTWTCGLAVSSGIVSILSREASIQATISGVISVQIGAEIASDWTSNFASLIGKIFIMRLTILPALICRSVCVVIRWTLTHTFLQKRISK